MIYLLKAVRWGMLALACSTCSNDRVKGGNVVEFLNDMRDRGLRNVKFSVDRAFKNCWHCASFDYSFFFYSNVWFQKNENFWIYIFKSFFFSLTFYFVNIFIYFCPPILTSFSILNFRTQWSSSDILTRWIRRTVS